MNDIGRMQQDRADAAGRTRQVEMRSDAGGVQAGWSSARGVQQNSASSGRSPVPAMLGIGRPFQCLLAKFVKLRQVLILALDLSSSPLTNSKGVR